MIKVTLIGFALVAATVTIHAFGLATLALYLRDMVDKAQRIRSLAWILVRIAWFLILIHGVEISIWALAYRLLECFPEVQAAFYFSGTTYTTIGYGDLVLSPPWQMLGPIEGMTGILMCSLSGAFFFAVVNRIIGPRLASR